ncbi:MAG: MFS transporter, partial [Opitutales bacterium]|nr:MFS transporter [Opitutales bacterium]
MKKELKTSLGTFPWHNGAQFGGALNDNLFKLLIIYAITSAWPQYDERTLFAVVGVFFALPFLLFLGFAGTLADRLPKNLIVRRVKVAETLIMLVGAGAVFSGNGWLMLATVFAMSTQSALFSPTKFGIVPELAGQENISRANGFMQAASYLAMILGTVLAPALTVMFDYRYGGVALVCAGIGFLGYLAARKIEPTQPANPEARANIIFLKDIYRSLQHVHRDGFLTLAVYFSSFFLLIAAFVQMNLISYGTEHLNLANQQEATYLFLVVALGIVAGALFAGKVSRRGIEFGIVPIGLGFLALSSMGFYLIPSGAVGMAIGLCAMMGIGAGLFLVPVHSFVQFRSPPEKRGGIIAASGWLSWLGVLTASLLLYLCSAVFGWDPAESFLFVAVLVLLMAVLSMVVLPDFFVRFVALVLTRCFYRLRVNGMENLPAHGPGVLVCNHVTVMDALWITAIQQRRIRFIMSRQILERSSWILQKLLRLGGVIPIHEEDGPKDLMRSLKVAREALEKGYLVAIFPEGRLTRTGHMLPFKTGFEKIIRRTEAPVIPLYIEGGYGTRASLSHGGAPKMLHPRDFRRQITVAVGSSLPTETPAAEVQEAVRDLATSATEAYAPIRGSAGRCFVRTAKRYWGRFAMADSSGKELTYGKTLTGAILLRSLLRQELKDDPTEIGVLIPPSVGGALTNLALAMDFRVSVNLNYTASEGAIASAIKQTGMRTVVTSRKVREKFPDLPMPEKVIYLEDLLGKVSGLAKFWALLQARLLPAPWVVNDFQWNKDDPLTILFSSGSTAEPKGIRLTHHNVLSNIDGFRIVARPQPDDRLTGVLPFFHSMGYTTTLWFPLTSGLGVAYHNNPLETGPIGELAEKYDPTILIGTPTFLMAWVRKIDPAKFRKLRWVVAGAEKLRPKLADMFERRYGIRPLEGYGATECSPVISVNVPDVEVAGYRQEGCREGTVGRPLPNLRVRIADPDTGETVKPGEPGLLWVYGPSVMHG